MQADFYLRTNHMALQHHIIAVYCHDLPYHRRALQPPGAADLPALVGAARYVAATTDKPGGGDEALARGRVRPQLVQFNQ